MEIEDHYSLLLGINSPWELSSVDLDMGANRVDIVVEHTDASGPCPECDEISPKHDDRNARTWRHLDTMQFATYLHCELPRIKCKTHGAKTVVDGGVKPRINGEFFKPGGVGGWRRQGGQ